MATKQWTLAEMKRQVDKVKATKAFRTAFLKETKLESWEEAVKRLFFLFFKKKFLLKNN